jgi:CHAD domain-containing protein
MRVATRRMRAAFEVFESALEPKAIKPHLKGLRATGRVLGGCVTWMFSWRRRSIISIPCLRTNAMGWIRCCLPGANSAPAIAQMLEYLEGRDYAAFKHRFLDFLTTPGKGARSASQDTPAPDRVRQVVPVLVYTRLAAVRAYEPLLNAATLEQLHALRIEFKKLRYTLEYFREVLGGESKAVIDEIKTMQDHLGT